LEDDISVLEERGAFLWRFGWVAPRRRWHWDWVVRLRHEVVSRKVAVVVVADVYVEDEDDERLIALTPYRSQQAHGESHGHMSHFLTSQNDVPKINILQMSALARQSHITL
jgi:hypothetical protein